MAHSEGKTTYDSFERNLSQRLMTVVLSSSFSTGTELLIAAFLSKVDNLHEEYQKNLAKRLTREFYAHLFCEFDMSTDLHMQLIKMCVRKGIFVDDTHEKVIYTLTMFGQDLQRIYASPTLFE